METINPEETESGANPNADEPPDDRKPRQDYYLFKNNQRPIVELRADYNLHVQQNHPERTGVVFHPNTTGLSFFGLIFLREFLETRGYTLPELEEPIPTMLANGIMHDVGVIQDCNNAFSKLNLFTPTEESLTNLEARIDQANPPIKLFLPLRGFSLTEEDKVAFNYSTADVTCIQKQGTHSDRLNTPTYTLKRGNTSLTISAQLCNGVSRLLISGKDQAAIHPCPNIHYLESKNPMIGYVPIIRRK